ncbi:MAG: hypothetical protein EPN40_02785 [Rhodanobacteraceae bacterium]|nr:MAG: hypothetical protein EPN40_02785 [Rhodanobacteraceae bacterium]
MYEGARRLAALARAAATALAADLTEAGRDTGDFDAVSAARAAGATFTVLMASAARPEDLAAATPPFSLIAFAVFFGAAFFTALAAFVVLRATLGPAGALRAVFLAALPEVLRFRVVAIAACPHVVALHARPVGRGLASRFQRGESPWAVVARATTRDH